MLCMGRRVSSLKSKWEQPGRSAGGTRRILCCGASHRSTGGLPCGSVLQLGCNKGRVRVNSRHGFPSLDYEMPPGSRWKLDSYTRGPRRT